MLPPRMFADSSSSVDVLARLSDGMKVGYYSFATNQWYFYSLTNPIPNSYVQEWWPLPARGSGISCQV